MTDEFIQPLLAWYDENKRILPWRDKHNAYYTWVSEIHAPSRPAWKL